MRLGDKLTRFMALAPCAEATPEPPASTAAEPLSAGTGPEPSAESEPAMSVVSTLRARIEAMRSAAERRGEPRVSTRHDRRGSAFDPTLERRILASEVPQRLEDALPGRAIETSRGPVWVAETRHAPADLHGDRRLGDALRGSYEHLRRVTGDARLDGFDPRRALYLDIEATGLEHGAGTLAFMIGLGFFEGDSVCVQQLIVREPDEEGALLELLWEAIHRWPYLVSFNGKSFDLSVLQSRLVMHRFCSAREGELKLRPHLDLLHLSRTVYRGLWDDVRLQTLERRVLGFERHDDMPGALAPTCFFAWLRNGDAGPLGGIGRHNRWDVLSMVGLAGHLADDALPQPDPGRRARIVLNLASLYLRRREPRDALSVLDGLPSLMTPVEREEALTLEATASRRVGDHERLARALAELAERRPEDLTIASALARALRRAHPTARLTTRPAVRRAGARAL